MGNQFLFVSSSWFYLRSWDMYGYVLSNRFDKHNQMALVEDGFEPSDKSFQRAVDDSNHLSFL